MTVTHCAEEEAEAQRGYATCLRPLSGQGLDAGISKAGQSECLLPSHSSLQTRHLEGREEAVLREGFWTPSTKQTVQILVNPHDVWHKSFPPPPSRVRWRGVGHRESLHHTPQNILKSNLPTPAPRLLTEASWQGKLGRCHYAMNRFQVLEQLLTFATVSGDTKQQF